MNSALSSSANKRSSPGWCKAGKWIGIPGLEAGVPIRLAAYARWEIDYGETKQNVAESLQLSYNAEEKSWSGSSNDEGTNLALTVETLPGDNHYTITLTVREGRNPIDSYTWLNIPVKSEKPFDTGPLRAVIGDDNWIYEVHAKG